MDKGKRIASIGFTAPTGAGNYTWMEDDDTSACLDGYYTARQLRDIAEVIDETPMSRKIEITSVTDISRIQMAEHLEHLAGMLRKGAGLVHGGLYARTRNSLMGDIELSEPVALIEATDVVGLRAALAAQDRTAEDDLRDYGVAVTDHGLRIDPSSVVIRVAPPFPPTAEPAAQGEAADPLADDSPLQSRRAFVESWRLESTGSNGHDVIANRNTVRRLVHIIDHLAAQPRAVPDGWRETILSVLSALDVATGDSDPNIDPDMNDDEVREEYPEVWAMQQLSAMLAAAPSPTQSVEDKPC